VGYPPQRMDTYEGLAMMTTNLRQNLNASFAPQARRVKQPWDAPSSRLDPPWKYVSVRRLFVFLERSMYADMQRVVFEPNDDRPRLKPRPRSTPPRHPRAARFAVRLLSLGR